MTDSAGSLRAVLEAAAGELEAVATSRTPDRTEWSIGGRAFASTTADAADFRLAPAVAAAALRTPDTKPSSRGAHWVTFRPSVVDRHAADRAAAWLASAWRRADGEG